MPDKVSCPSCGASNDFGAPSCHMCGSFLIQDNKSASPNSSSKPNSVEGAISKFTSTEEPKSWMVTLLLAIFLGGFGVHRFYTGYMKIGLIQFLLSLLCGLGVIWAIYDIIMIVTNKYVDSAGRPLVK